MPIYMSYKHKLIEKEEDARMRLHERSLSSSKRKGGNKMLAAEQGKLDIPATEDVRGEQDE